MGRFVMVFRGAASVLPAALEKVMRVPGLTVLQQTSSGLLQVAWSGDESALCAAIADCGVWVAGEERTYHLEPVNINPIQYQGRYGRN